MLQVQPKWDVFDLFLSKIHDRHQGSPLGDAEENINTANATHTNEGIDHVLLNAKTQAIGSSCPSKQTEGRCIQNQVDASFVATIRYSTDGHHSSVPENRHTRIWYNGSICEKSCKAAVSTFRPLLLPHTTAASVRHRITSRNPGSHPLKHCRIIGPSYFLRQDMRHVSYASTSKVMEGSIQGEEQ
jgi:hypothetical protein